MNRALAPSSNGIASSADRWKGLIWKQFDDNLIWFIIAACLLILLLGVRGFLSYNTLVALIVSAVYIGILAIGESLCLLVGMIDLSIESTLAFSAAVSMLMFQRGQIPAFLVIPIILLIGLGVGFFNAVFIVKLGVNPFVQTLAVLVMLRGLVILITGGETLIKLPQWYRVIGTGAILGVPFQIFVLLGLYIIFIVLLQRRPWGRRIYATGSNIRAAVASGINVQRIIMSTFIVNGFLAAVVGFIFSARVGAVYPSLGDGWIFDVFAAAVIGGISLQGGRGKLAGALGGVIFLSIISTMIVWLNMPIMAVRALRGALILVAVLLDAIKNKLRVRVFLL